VTTRKHLVLVRNEVGDRCDPRPIVEFAPSFDPKKGRKMWVDRSGRFYNADVGHTDFACYFFGVDYDEKTAHDYRAQLQKRGWIDVELFRELKKLEVRRNLYDVTPAQRRALSQFAEEAGCTLVIDHRTAWGSSRVPPSTPTRTCLRRFG